MADTRIAEGIKAIVVGSGEMAELSLAVIAGTILTIISTSYIRPVNSKIRLIYLLFVPGWLCLFFSIYHNNLISRRAIAAVFAKNDNTLTEIFGEINHSLIDQLNYFKFGLLFFGIWLVLFLLWWVFGNWKIGRK